jgi:hypothetical protein
MPFRSAIPFLVLTLILCHPATAQFLDRPLDRVDSLGRTVSSAGDTYAMVELQAVQTGERVPFWMRSLHYGGVPVSGTSVSAIGTFVRDYDRDSLRRFDWGGGFQLRTNLGGTTQAILTEAYAKVRFGMFEFRAGRSREVFGLSDTALGSGSFAVSGNALGIPKVGLSIPDYSLPLFNGLFSFKGAFSYGWLGETPVNDRSVATPLLPTFYHEKSLHMRIGRKDARVRGVVGVVHHAYWFHGWELWGSAYELNGLQEFYYVATGKNYSYKPGTGSTLTTNIGNHLGSIDAGLEIPGSRFDTRIYHQVLYESENSFKNGSLSDGLTGVSVTNRKPRSRGLTFRKGVFEFFRTTNQAYDPARPFNYDSYYNHEFLLIGNSYKGLIMGNPFITAAPDMRAELPLGDPRNVSSNTRVRLFHLGLEAAAANLFLRTRLSFSRNLGVYETLSRFPESPQFSGMLEAAMPLKGGWQARALFAFDSGELLYNTSGGFLSMAKVF